MTKLFENEDWVVHQDECFSYIKEKSSEKVTKFELDDKFLLAKYVEIIKNGEFNVFSDTMFEDFIKEEIENNAV